MADPLFLDQITERVERLLLRHEELRRTNALLLDQINLLQSERDSLKSRLHAARARIDALLEHMPVHHAGTDAHRKDSST
jgi:cell division protein ZapB